VYPQVGRYPPATNGGVISHSVKKVKGRVLVATTGRVKVKVDVTSGPIEIGVHLKTAAL